MLHTAARGPRRRPRRLRDGRRSPADRHPHGRRGGDGGGARPHRRDDGRRRRGGWRRTSGRRSSWTASTACCRTAATGRHTDRRRDQMGGRRRPVSPRDRPRDRERPRGDLRPRGPRDRDGRDHVRAHPPAAGLGRAGPGRVVVGARGVGPRPPWTRPGSTPTGSPGCPSTRHVHGRRARRLGPPRCARRSCGWTCAPPTRPRRIGESGDPARKYNAGGKGAVSAEWLPSKLLWLKEKEPETYERRRAPRRRPRLGDLPPHRAADRERQHRRDARVPRRRRRRLADELLRGDRARATSSRSCRPTSSRSASRSRA